MALWPDVWGRAAQADLSTAGTQISAFYLAHGESFGELREVSDPAEIAPDWPSHAGKPIGARVVSEDVACLEAVTPRDQAWTLVVVMNPVSYPEIPAGKWWGAGPMSTWCGSANDIAGAIDTDGDGFADVNEGDNPIGGVLSPVPGSNTAPSNEDGGPGGNSITTVTRTLTVPAGMTSLEAYGEDWYFGCPGMVLIPGSGRYTVDPEPETHHDYYLEDIGAYGVYVDNRNGTEDVLIEASVDCEEAPESTDPIWVQSDIVVIPAGSGTEELFAEGALTLICPTGEFLWARYSIHTGEPEYINDSVWANTYRVWVENYEGSEPVELEAYGECG